MTLFAGILIGAGLLKAIEALFGPIGPNFATNIELTYTTPEGQQRISVTPEAVLILPDGDCVVGSDTACRQLATFISASQTQEDTIG